MLLFIQQVEMEGIRYILAQETIKFIQLFIDLVSKLFYNYLCWLKHILRFVHLFACIVETSDLVVMLLFEMINHEGRDAVYFMHAFEGRAMLL